MTNPTDWRALCAIAIESWDADCDMESVISQMRTALAQPEPQGPPKNCWLDDEPGLCPSPCVFDDPSEVIDSCVEARCLSLEGKPKEACKYYRTTAQPEPQGPTDEELWEAYDQMDGAPEDWAWVRDYASAVLTRYARPTIQPVPVAERLPGPEDCDADGRCWWGVPAETVDPNDERVSAAGWALVGVMPDATHWLPHYALPVPEVR